MATTARREVWIYATWLSGLLSGEKHCAFSPWIRSNFKIEKRPRDFDLAAWTAEHTDMVIARARELEADGWTVFLEDQNEFKLRGQAGVLSGKCDIVAVRGDEAKISDCKSGQQRDSDFWQVLEYILALQLIGSSARPSVMAIAVTGKRISGELVYKTHRREVLPEEFTPAFKQRIIDVIKQMGAATPPAKVPSAKECAFCDVDKTDCPERIDEPIEAVANVDVF